MTQRSVAILSLAALLAATGCDDDSDSPAAGGPDAGAAGCQVQALAGQPQTRFPVGSTYWLPRAVGCEGAEWAHANGTGEVYTEADGQARFTPTAPGTYEFTLGDTGQSFTLTAVDPTGWPFHNFNYYPSRSQAVVDEALWVANAYAPTVSVLDGQTLDQEAEIPVGPWPVALGFVEGMSQVLVAQRAGDTVGFIDVASRALVDAIWVGDEPSNLLVSADGSTAWVSLATESAVAEIDVASRTVTRRIAVGTEPFGMAVSPDGATLYVASQRSGQVGRYPYGDGDPEAERDIAVVDLASGEVSRWLMDVGTTLNALLVSPDGAALYVAGNATDNVANFVDEDAPNFRHQVVRVDLATGDQRGVDVGRQPSSGGYAVSLHSLTYGPDGRIWLVAEASDLALGLNADTLAEEVRVETPGRPRHIVAGPDALYVHGNQGFEVFRLSPDGTVQANSQTTEDPRPASLAAGQRYFSGTGREFAQNWGCDGCHAEARSDTVIWKAGPFETAREVTRPLFWLEGTYPLGWGGYVRSPRNFAFATNTNVGIRPNSDEAESLADYLESLMPPPAANGYTQRDGALSEQAERGKAIYEGKGACAGCHPLPLTTSRVVVPEGITPGVTDIPALVGAYRHNVWLKHGDAHTVREAIDAVLTRNGQTLTDDEVDDLTRYTLELTARDFFVLATDPRPDEKLRAGEPIRVIFSLPVYDDAANLALIELHDGDDQPVAVTAEADGRHVVLTPDAPLDPGAAYTVVIDPGFESLSERGLFAAERHQVTTGAAADLRLEGEYTWTLDLPAPDFPNDRFDPSTTVPVSNGFVFGEGNELVVDYGDDLLYPTRAFVEGSTLYVPSILVAVTTSFSDTRGLEVALEDTDGDGVADRGTGTLTMTGPGFEVPGVTFALTKDGQGPVGCPEGPEGDVAVTVDRGDGGPPVISWEGEDVNLLGFYVTDPGARLPLGPGQTVRDGAAYWAVSTIEFPAGFAGPITYGELPEGAMDVSEENGAPAGGAELEAGRCYQFSVITNQFQIASFTLTW